MTHVATFTVRRASASRSCSPGSRRTIVDHREPVDAERALAETEAYWRKWFESCTYDGE